MKTRWRPGSDLLPFLEQVLDLRLEASFAGAPGFLGGAGAVALVGRRSGLAGGSRGHLGCASLSAAAAAAPFPATFPLKRRLRWARGRDGSGLGWGAGLLLASGSRGEAWSFRRGLAGVGNLFGALFLLLLILFVVSALVVSGRGCLEGRGRNLDGSRIGAQREHGGRRAGCIG